MEMWRSFQRTLKKVAVACVALSMPAAVTVTPANAHGFGEIGDPGRFVQRSKHTLWDYSREVKRFIVKFNALQGQTEETNTALLNEIAGEYGSTASKVRDGQDGTWIVELEPAIRVDDVLRFRADLESKAQINWADPDYYMVPFWRPNDPLYAYQWQYANGGYNYKPEKSINAEAAWELGYRGDGINIAIVDSGITNHPDLNQKVLGGFDMVNDDHVANDGETSSYGQRDFNPADTGDWSDYGYCAPGAPSQPSTWHGTHVAGLAAASTDNGIGVAGAAPDANIVPVRVLGACGGYESDIADGMVWAAGGYVPNTPSNRNPARVVNLSLGGPGRCSRYYQSSVDKARRQGAVLLTAAGNDDIDIANIQPASCRGVFVIGSTGPEGEKSAFSNWGFEMDLAAPGGNSVFWQDRAAGILSTINTGQREPERADYGYIDGTSMATPLVSGVVAMMLHANPDLTNTRIEQILKDTAQPFGVTPRRNIGVGILDAYEAVCQAIRDRGGRDCDEDEATPTSSPTPVAETTTASTTMTVSTTVTPPRATKVVTTQTTPRAAVATTTATNAYTLSETTTATTTKLATSTTTTTVGAAPVTKTVTERTTAPTVTVTETVGATKSKPAQTSTSWRTATVTPEAVTSIVVETKGQETTTRTVVVSTATTDPAKVVTETPRPVWETATMTTAAEAPVTLTTSTVQAKPSTSTVTSKKLATVTATDMPATVNATKKQWVTETETATSTEVVTETSTRHRSAPTVTATTTMTEAPVTETVRVTALATAQPEVVVVEKMQPAGVNPPAAEAAASGNDDSVTGSSEGPWWLILVAAAVGLAATVAGIVANNPSVANLPFVNAR